MQDMIKKLVEIDEQARLYSEETERERDRLEHEIELDAKAIEEKYMADAKDEVEKETEALKQKNAESFEKKDNIRKASLKKLEEKFRSEKDNWVNRIVDNVLS